MQSTDKFKPNTRLLFVTIEGAGERTCASCKCMDADETMLYCGIFRKTLKIDVMSVCRLQECIEAERNCKESKEV